VQQVQQVQQVRPVPMEQWVQQAPPERQELMEQ